MYARARIANKLIEKAVGGESAFIDAQKHKWERTQRGFAWWVELSLHGSYTGALGTISSVVNADPVFTCTISSGTWKAFNFEVGILVNVASGTDIFEVTSVTRSSRTVVLTRQAGTQVPGNEIIYMQNSKDVSLLSIPDVLLATSGSLYGVTVQDGWKAHQQLAVAVPIDEELIDNAVLDIEANCGEAPDWIITSRKQWKVLKAANTNLKRIVIPNAGVPSKLAMALGFTALEYSSPAGNKAVPIMYSRFIEDDRVYLINKGRSKLKHCNAPRWFERDGTVFLRTPDNKDDLEARFYSYMENFMYPTYHGVITGLL
jgi:hypothetical protein